MALQWGQILLIAGVMAASVAIATCVWLWRAHKGRARILPTTKEGRPLNKMEMIGEGFLKQGDSMLQLGDSVLQLGGDIVRRSDSLLRAASTSLRRKSSNRHLAMSTTLDSAAMVGLVQSQHASSDSDSHDPATLGGFQRPGTLRQTPVLPHQRSWSRNGAPGSAISVASAGDASASASRRSSREGEGGLRARSHRDQILAELGNVPMFQEIIEIETLVVIASKCALKRYEEGEHIVVEGCPGDSMYVVKSGRVSVTQSCNTDSVVQHQGPAHIELAQLGPKDIFGEMSVLVGHARSATVTTLTFVECVEIPKEALRTVLLSQPNKAGHANFCQTIAAVVTERRSELNMSQRQEFEIELTRDIEKHFDMKKIHQLLRMVPLFEPVLDDDNLLTLLASRSEIVRFDQGETIVRQGGQGDCMFVVKTGSVVVSIRFVHCDTGIEMPDVQVATLYEGDFFGEMTLLIGEKRSASVIAVEETECIKISKYALLPLLIARADVGLSIAQLITDRQLENRREIGQSLGNQEEAAKELSEVISSNYDIDNLIQLFATVPVFSELTKQQELLRTVAAHSSLEKFLSSTLIVVKDEPGQSMYIVRSGVLQVTLPTAQGAESSIAILKKGDYFGEMSLLTGEARSANVRALENSECVRIPQSALLPVLIAWPTFTVNIARSVTMRRTKLIKKGEWTDARPLDDLASDINNFYDVASFVVLFRSASVFEALWEDKQLLTALASKCKLVSFKQGSVILRQKEKQTDPVMYIIQSGEVNILVEVEKEQAGKKSGARRWSISHSDNPSVFQVETLGAGSTFGESSLLTGEPRCATVTASCHCVCLEVPTSALLPIMIAKPQMSYQMAELVTERRHRLARTTTKTKGVSYLSDRTDHFFRVDQVLRQHTSMVEEQAMSGMRLLMW